MSFWPFTEVECLYAIEEGDIETAKTLYSSFKDMRSPRFIALGARIKMIEGKFNSARKCFEKAKQAAIKKGNKRAKYVEEYCNFGLSLLDNDGRDVEHLHNALHLNPSRAAFKTLPLPDERWAQVEQSDKLSPKRNTTGNISVHFSFDQNYD